VGQLHTLEKECYRWRRRKEDRPAEILKAALKTFSKKGFAATKLVEVAKEAGVSKATLYLYFESKEALFKAVVSEFVLPQIAKAEEQAEDYNGPIKDLLLALVEQWRTNILETDLSGIPKMLMAEATNFPDLANFYLENVIRRSHQFIAKLIDIGIQRGEFRECNSLHTARAFMTPLVFTAIWKNSLAPFDDSYDIDEQIEFNMDIFMRGILKDKQE